ncbi:putative sec7 domain protein [Phaeomoniella chlamydospora]|uniref:Putative sec7 domain protein n=1 Tax=Phaeomoniella chlamydospora TaxID=158046 RepID=A0A0G2E6M9_PHACM|nr:putative sec7 domain protein [Phaeomoniella chlamydospora]
MSYEDHVQAQYATGDAGVELPKGAFSDTLNGHDTTIRGRRGSRIAITVDPISLVTTECVSVTSAMRRHPRWAQSSVSAILGGAGTSKLAERSASGKPVKSNGKKVSLERRRSGIDEVITQEDDLSLAGRWGLRGKKGRSIQDNPLLAAFSQLRSDLTRCKNIQEFDAPSLLHPFLQVIRSSSTSAGITSLAVVAISKFFAYNLITKDSPRISLAMQNLSAAITHCRFEASDSAADEIVLLRILKLMENIISRPEGLLLGDQSLCAMMECGLSMCCQARLSEVLRRSAEMAMANMTQVIFERLKTVSIVHDPTKTTKAPSADELHMEPSVDGTSVVAGSAQQPELDLASTAMSTPMSTVENLTQPQTQAPAPAVTASVEIGETEEGEIKPYGLPSIRELFRVLINILDPHDRQYTDPLRVMALRIIDVALEVAGPSIASHPSLANLAKDDLCRYLFQLVRSENMILLNGSLRVAGTLLATCRGVLKLQQELFLSYLVACLHLRVEIPEETGIDRALYEGIPQAPKLVKPPPSQTSSGRSTPVPVKDRQKLGMEGGSRRPEAREAMVESISALVRIPTFMAELFRNYDCDEDRSDLCEDLVGLLARNAFPDSATWSTTNVPPLCLDALLTYVQSIFRRLASDDNRPSNPDEVSRLREQRKRKRIIIRGAARFNEDPKGGIAYLASQGVIEDPRDPVSVARFLKATTRISKKMLGEYISKKSNEPILVAFISSFNFDGKRPDEALRDLLGSFRLPGESALIERIVTVFAEKYCGSSVPGDVADKDAMFVLTYAIIMLNTDLYNPNVKSQNRMTYNDFSRNLRGVNAGQDFAPEFLEAIYNSIKQNEIILPEEHDNKHAFDYAWKELLLKTSTSGDLVACQAADMDGDMFEANWKPIVATLSYVFMSASDDVVFNRVAIGFTQCARIAAHYDLTEAFDRIVFCLTSISTLASEKLPNTSLNTEVQAEKKSVMVSELAVKFGRNYRAQLATIVLFRILSDHKPTSEAADPAVDLINPVDGLNTLNKSWPYVIRILVNLFINSLIPHSPAQGSGHLKVDPIPLQPPTKVIDRNDRANESGLLSAFTSYLSSYAADDPPEPSDEELEDTLSAFDCISACQLDILLPKIMSLSTKSIRHVVIALLSQLPEESTPIVTVKPERPTHGSRAGTQKVSTTGPAYAPNVVYLLEFATVLAMKNKDTMELVGEEVTATLQNTVRDSSNLHPLVISRVVHYLLSFMKAGYDLEFMRAPVVLHSISRFDQDNLDSAGTTIIKGLCQCVQEAGPLRNEITASPDFWSILERLRVHKEAAEEVFNVLQLIATSQPPTVTADNYESVISLANGFATDGSVGAVFEQKRDMAARRGKQTKPAKPPENETVTRGVRAITITYSLTSLIPSFIKQSHLERNEAWAAYWSPIFRAFCDQCVNPCREIRHQSTAALQRSLLSPELASPDHTEWTAIFGEVLFPLILLLLKPEVYQLDPIGMSETRVQAATLVCKVFLHYLVLLSEHWDGMLDLWLRILDILDRMMNSGQGDTLEEAVPESLKNILLVMAAGGYLVPPTEGKDASNNSEGTSADEDKGKVKLWIETQKRLERFVPELWNEIFPPPAPAAATTVVPSQQMEQQQPVEHEQETENEKRSSEAKDRKR